MNTCIFSEQVRVSIRLMNREKRLDSWEKDVFSVNTCISVNEYILMKQIYLQ